MDRIKYFFCNLLWLFLSTVRYLKFRLACLKIEKIQKKILLKNIRKNQSSKFGNAHNFSQISDVAEFQTNITITDYDYFHEYITALETGCKNVLSNEKVLIFEPTSGSTGSSKLIPYNESLREEFKNGISPWVFNLLTSNRKLMLGAFYWSITPVVNELNHSSCGIPIGFKDDGEYFGTFEKWLIDKLTVVPKEVCLETDVENYRYITLYFLLINKNLSFISIWNPTFLTLLIKPMGAWMNSLVDDIEYGRLTVPNKHKFVSGTVLLGKLKPNPKRAKVLRDIINGQGLDNLGNFYQAIWPNLVMISCWCDGTSSTYVIDLEELFPFVDIQPKGLMLTEGFVSLPHKNVKGTALSIRSHFFEFVDGENEVHLVHELKKGEKYVVVITTGGGLYRYRTGDVVEVVDFLNQCPCIRFIERENNVSDLFGEKINEKNISIILKEVFTEHGVVARFFMVAPEEFTGNNFAYVLFIEHKTSSGYDWVKIRHDIEKKLRANYHYDYCRKLGQLMEFRIFAIEKEGLSTYIDTCCSFGQRLGDIKQQVINKKTGWSKRFEGEFIL